jgi:hypothetical protein
MLDSYRDAVALVQLSLETSSCSNGLPRLIARSLDDVTGPETPQYEASSLKRYCLGDTFEGM